MSQALNQRNVFTINSISYDKKNQKKVFKYLHVITQYLYIPLGQIPVICEMFKENLHLNFEFFLVAPVSPRNKPPHYTIFIETNASNEKLRQALHQIENHLSTGHHYSYCRKLGQLGPMQVVRVHNAMEIYQRTLMDQGIRLGDIKPTHFDHRRIWNEAFKTALAPAFPDIQLDA